MSAAVFYYSKGGITKKIADRIAGAVGATAQNVSENLQAKADTVFIGASVYAGSPASEVLDFLRRNKDKIGKLVVFGSSASGKSTHKKISEAAKELGITVSDNYFSCYGHFLFMHKNRPNEEDLQKAEKFAKENL